MKEYYFNEEHILFRKSLQDFVAKEVTPFVDQWEEEGRRRSGCGSRSGGIGGKATATGRRGGSEDDVTPQRGGRRPPTIQGIV